MCLSLKLASNWSLKLNKIILAVHNVIAQPIVYIKATCLVYVRYGRVVNEYPELTVARSERDNTEANIKDVLTSKKVRRRKLSEWINQQSKQKYRYMCKACCKHRYQWKLLESMNDVIMGATRDSLTVPMPTRTFQFIWSFIKKC